LVVDGNMAVMSGTVRDASLPSYIGRRVLLVAGDDVEAEPKGERQDRLTWGFYKIIKRDWIPSDAELKDDNGASLTWIATDAERRDDEGVPYPLKDDPITPKSFPLSTYSFLDVQRWSGYINVHP
jgi:hypothetical protein